MDSSFETPDESVHEEENEEAAGSDAEVVAVGQETCFIPAYSDIEDDDNEEDIPDEEDKVEPEELMGLEDLVMPNDEYLRLKCLSPITVKHDMEDYERDIKPHIMGAMFSNPEKLQSGMTHMEIDTILRLHTNAILNLESIAKALFPEKIQYIKNFNYLLSDDLFSDIIKHEIVDNTYRFKPNTDKQEALAKLVEDLLYGEANARRKHERHEKKKMEENELPEVKRRHLFARNFLITLLAKTINYQAKEEVTWQEVQTSYASMMELKDENRVYRAYKKELALDKDGMSILNSKVCNFLFGRSSAAKFLSQDLFGEVFHVVMSQENKGLLVKFQDKYADNCYKQAMKTVEEIEKEYEKAKIPHKLANPFLHNKKAKAEEEREKRRATFKPLDDDDDLLEDHGVFGSGVSYGDEQTTTTTQQQQEQYQQQPTRETRNLTVDSDVPAQRRRSEPSISSEDDSELSQKEFSDDEQDAIAQEERRRKKQEERAMKEEKRNNHRNKQSTDTSTTPSPLSQTTTTAATVVNKDVVEDQDGYESDVEENIPPSANPWETTNNSTAPTQKPPTPQHYPTPIVGSSTPKPRTPQPSQYPPPRPLDTLQQFTDRPPSSGPTLRKPKHTPIQTDLIHRNEQQQQQPAPTSAFSHINKSQDSDDKSTIYRAPEQKMNGRRAAQNPFGTGFQPNNTTTNSSRDNDQGMGYDRNDPYNGQAHNLRPQEGGYINPTYNEYLNKYHDFEQGSTSSRQPDRGTGFETGCYSGFSSAPQHGSSGGFNARPPLNNFGQRSHADFSSHNHYKSTEFGGPIASSRDEEYEDKPRFRRENSNSVFGSSRQSQNPAPFRDPRPPSEMDFARDNLYGGHQLPKEPPMAPSRGSLADEWRASQQQQPKRNSQPSRGPPEPARPLRASAETQTDQMAWYEYVMEQNQSNSMGQEEATSTEDLFRNFIKHMVFSYRAHDRRRTWTFIKEGSVWESMEEELGYGFLNFLNDIPTVKAIPHGREIVFEYVPPS